MPTTPMIQLTIEVPPQTVEKIKALNSISGLDADQIIESFADAIDFKLNDEIIRYSKDKIQKTIDKEKAILESCGINPDFLINPVNPVCFSSSPLPAINPVQLREVIEQFPVTDPVLPVQEIQTNEESTEGYVDMLEDEEDDDDFDMGGSLGGDESDFDAMDTLLPDKAIEEMKDLKGEEPVPVVDKDGKESGYEDDFMNDLQAEAEDSDGLGDDIMAAAASSYDSDEDMDGGYTGNASSDKPARGDDTPTGEEGYTPDILPVDLGLGDITSDSDAGANFFAAAISGTVGDTSKRNSVRRVKRE